MTCVKTGCHIWLEPYREFAYGDAFCLEPVLAIPENKHVWRKLREQKLDEAVRDFYCFRLVARSFSPINFKSNVDFVVHNWDQWFDKDGRCSTMLSNHVSKSDALCSAFGNFS